MKDIYVKISVKGSFAQASTKGKYYRKVASFFFGPFSLSKEQVKTWAEEQVKSILSLGYAYELGSDFRESGMGAPPCGYIDIPMGRKALYEKDNVTFEIVKQDEVDRKRLYARPCVKQLFWDIKQLAYHFHEDGTMRLNFLQERLRNNRSIIKNAREKLKEVIQEAKKNLAPVPKNYGPSQE